MSLIFWLLLIILRNMSDGAVNNVLLVAVDDLRPEIGAYHGAAVTPNMDKIARSGVLFENTYAQMALCAPSRNSFLTSRRPDTVRLYDFYSYWRDVAGNYTTLPQYLKQSGYHTYSIGKIFHPGDSSNHSDDFPYSWSEPPWHPTTDIFKDSASCNSNGSWRRNVVCPVKISEQPGQTLPDIESTQRAVSYMRSRRGQDTPFFLALGYHKPHVPFRFPENYLDLYPMEKISLPEVRSKPEGLPPVAWNPWNDLRHREDVAALNLSYPYQPFSDDWVRRMRQSYYASISYIDDLLGTVLQSLRENGFENNTVVVFMGDHGWLLGENGEWGKCSNLDAALRTPFIMSVPRLSSGLRISQPVELLDVFPTLVDVLNLKPVPQCSENIPSKESQLCTEGKSLLPLMLGKQIASQPAFSQYPRPGLTPSKHPASDIPKLAEITIMGYSMRTIQYRYTLWVSWQSFIPNWSDVKAAELYDHVTDPHENHNLAGDSAFQLVETDLRTVLIQKFNSSSVSNVCLTCPESGQASNSRKAQLDSTGVTSRSAYTAVINLNQVIHETNARYLSFGLDTSFVKNKLRKMTPSDWDKLTVPSRCLSPALLRLGGTDADRVIFAEVPEKDFVTLTKDDWIKVNAFAEKSNLGLLFDFNVLLRSGDDWNSSNARDLLKFSKDSKLNVSLFQLGNEPNSFLHVFNHSISPQQLGRDFQQLRGLLDADEYFNSSLLIGPDVTNPRASKFPLELKAISSSVSGHNTTKMRNARSLAQDSINSSTNTTKASNFSNTSKSPVTNSSTASNTSSTTTAPVTTASTVPTPSSSTTSPLTTSSTVPTPSSTTTTSTASTSSKTTKTPVATTTHIPDTDYSKLYTPPLEYLERFLNSTNIDSLSAVSWHHYYLNGRTATVEDFLDPTVLDSLSIQINLITNAVRSFSGTIPIWLTETGSAYGGGAPNLSDKYASVFLLLDKLGLASKLGVELIIRQTLYGGHYALLGETFDPNPDFWVSLLYKKLVGNRVYEVMTNESNNLIRLYAQNALPSICHRHPNLQTSLVVFGMNLGDETVDMSVIGTAELTFCGFYEFTAPKGNLQSQNIKLNGRILNWHDIGRKCDDFLNEFVSIDEVSELAAQSIGFWVFSTPQF